VEKESKIKKENKTSFMKNVLMLMVAQIAIKLLGFVYRLVIINVEGFGDIGNGYYNAGYQIYALLLTISSVGIPIVISKLVSERVSIGDYKGAHRIFTISLKLFTGLGVVFSFILFLGAEQIATHVLNISDVSNVLKVLAPAIMLVAASSVLRGYFAGLGSMKAASITQTLEQFLKCVLTVVFIYSLIGHDPSIMAAGGNLATTLAIVLSFMYLCIFYGKRRKDILDECKNQTIEMEDKTTKNLIKIILAISIPMTLGSLMSVINSAIDTITISQRSSNSI
jgi:stage V sporulation protein B